ncbi:hypothetical protein GCM10010415_64790 [Streptomyces atrovirens]|uniref:Uncharacterized protein n=1 Tax=Streptomyces atrovirens TaxID=285556 RepID=A0ABW0DM63_9ACTN
MVKAYGTADVYPVYRHQSAYSRTTGATADAFLIMDGDTLKFTTEPSGCGSPWSCCKRPPPSAPSWWATPWSRPSTGQWETLACQPRC